MQCRITVKFSYIYYIIGRDLYNIYIIYTVLSRKYAPQQF